MATLIHEYSIDLGLLGVGLLGPSLGAPGPMLRLRYNNHLLDSKEETGEFIKAKMGEPGPMVLVVSAKKEEKTTLVLQRNKHGKTQLMRLFGEEDAILAVSVISSLPLTPQNNLIETINQKIHKRFVKQDFYDLAEKEEDDNLWSF